MKIKRLGWILICGLLIFASPSLAWRGTINDFECEVLVETAGESLADLKMCKGEKNYIYIKVGQFDSLKINKLPVGFLRYPEDDEASYKDTYKYCVEATKVRGVYQIVFECVKIGLPSFYLPISFEVVGKGYLKKEGGLVYVTAEDQIRKMAEKDNELAMPYSLLGGIALGIYGLNHPCDFVASNEKAGVFTVDGAIVFPMTSSFLINTSTNYKEKYQELQNSGLEAKTTKREERAKEELKSLAHNDAVKRVSFSAAMIVAGALTMNSYGASYLLVGLCGVLIPTASESKYSEYLDDQKEMQLGQEMYGQIATTEVNN